MTFSFRCHSLEKVLSESIKLVEQNLRYETKRFYNVRCLKQVDWKSYMFSKRKILPLFDDNMKITSDRGNNSIGFYIIQINLRFAKYCKNLGMLIT